MKNIFYSFITTLFFVFFNINNSYSQQVNAKIQEVFGTKTQELVANDPERLALLNDLLDNRVKIIELSITSTEKYAKLSQVALVNKYNASLTRDAVFDPLNFNPLKYDLNILPKTPMVYRVDNTNYLIVIQPQTLKKD
jgi:hypothetical protein